jgi:ATP-dependent DNA helicase RecQ
MNMQDIHHILQQHWGHTSFRPLQQDIIESVLQKNDTLALLPTGGGKSICFQVPALINEGICVVITPLIALMQDQVDQLTKRGISAIAIYAGMSKKQIDIALDNCIYGQVKFIYVSPERLKTDLFVERAKQMNIALLVVDEAHCISQWGYDFRPPYLEISKFREIIPSVPCIALTASANQEVKLDIIEKLGFKNPKIFQKSFTRANLSYSCKWEENKDPQLVQMIKKVGGSSIVYARNRRKTQEIAQLLQKNGILADYYHAGLTTDVRTQRQQDWIQNKTECIVATNAFGMGIDKPDVRLVVHTDLPDTLEAYYQEAGRAGRDEKKAYAVILIEEKDVKDLYDNWEKTFPTPGVLHKTYQAISNYLQIAEGSGELSTYDFDWTEMARRFQLPSSETYFAIKTLESEGLLILNDAFQNPSKIRLQATASEVYDFMIRNEKFETFIKFLLRHYGGNLYTQFISISEANISQLIKMPLADVERILQLLSKFEILEYEKQSGLPKLTLLTPRANSESLPIIWSEYLTKKERSRGKINSIENYARSNTICRNRLITTYFGEADQPNCGICDNCIQRKKEAQGKAYPEGMENERQLILNYLKNGAMSLQDLTECLRPLTQAEAAKMIQYCLEMGDITYQSTDILALVSS